jgi:transcriptional/translational regulatory protein YebC/TACO1
MPQPASKASTVAHAVEGLVHSITALEDSLSSSVKDVKTVGKAAKGVKAAVKGQRGPGKGNPKLKSALKESWANYTPKQRAERVRKMLAGRGLKPKAREPRHHTTR